MNTTGMLPLRNPEWDTATFQIDILDEQGRPLAEPFPKRGSVRDGMRLLVISPFLNEVGLPPQPMWWNMQSGMWERDTLETFEQDPHSGNWNLRETPKPKA